MSRDAPIDYTDAGEFPAAVARTRERRGGPSTHPHVIGRWILEGDRVTFRGIPSLAWHADESRPLTAEASQWYRWRTRQGAHQWLKVRPRLKDYLVLNLDSLDVKGELD